MTQTSLFREAVRKLELSSFLSLKKMRQLVNPARNARSNKLHVFIPGMQRSGTNMLADVLERSFETDVYHERDARAFDQTIMRERSVIHALVERSRAPVFVIKALIETAQARSLMDEFVPSKALWIVRDFEDVVNSVLVSFNTMPQQVARVVAERDSTDWRARGMSDRTYDTLCRLHHERISPPSAAALFWYSRNILFFEQEFDRDPRVKLVRYEKLVTDPGNEVRDVFAFLNLTYRPQIARQIFATSIKRRPPPDIEPAVRAICQDLMASFDAVTSRSQVSTGIG